MTPVPASTRRACAPSDLALDPTGGWLVGTKPNRASAVVFRVAAATSRLTAPAR